MSIRNVIERARHEPPYVPAKTSFPDNFYTCEVLDPIAWDRLSLERSLGFEIPAPLVELWDICGGTRLYCDNLWLPAGLVVFSPNEAELLQQNQRYQRIWGDSVLHGDLVFGLFRDVTEPPVLCCDKDRGDYGSVVIVTEAVVRPEWYKAASSLEEFLTKFMDARGQKYWE